MMTKAFQGLWAAALESGKYKQGLGQLRSDKDEYCCLGVAADLVCPTKWIKQWGGNGSWGMIASQDADQDAEYNVGTFKQGYMTQECQTQAGINYEDQKVLSQMNDDGATFAEIAKYIRSMPTSD